MINKRSTRALSLHISGWTWKAFGALLVCSVGACTTSPNPEPSSSIEALTQGLVIRAGQCSKSAFEAGSDVHNGYLTGLSVNCTVATSNKANYTNYLQGIDGRNQYCVAKWSQMELRNITVKMDPVNGNNLHCLVSGKVDEVVKVLTKYP